MKEQLLKAIEELASKRGARFVSLVYTNKEGETARHTILLGASYETAKQRDLQRLLIKQPHLDGIAKVACEELIESYKKPQGENEAYTCANVYEQTPINGLKIHKESGELHLMGYGIAKVVLKPVEYKTVKSNEKTIAKNALRQMGRLGKIRQFKLTTENLQKITINGKTLVIE